jgi:hypothetical protein
LFAQTPFRAPKAATDKSRLKSIIKNKPLRGKNKPLTKNKPLHKKQATPQKTSFSAKKQATPQKKQADQRSKPATKQKISTGCFPTRTAFRISTVYSKS